MIDNIQALRALAALMVVAHHIFFALSEQLGAPPTEIYFGSRGVDVFFVISGFIMAETTQRRETTPARFALQRLIRLAPVYWLVTLVIVALVAAGFAPVGVERVDSGQLLTSLAFLPDVSAQGVRNPIVFVGWSLNYEAFFYALFALSLFLPRSIGRLWAACAALLAIWLAARIWDNPYLDYWGAHFLLEFVAGIVVWRLAQSAVLPRPAAFAGIALAFVMIVLSDRVASEIELVFALVAPASAILVWSAVSLEKKGLALEARPVRLMGDASYALYLAHPLAIHLGAKLCAPIATDALGWTIAALAMLACSVMAALALHVGFERPVTAWLRRRLDQNATALPERPVTL